MKILNFTTKYCIFLSAMFIIFLQSCTDAGTLENINKGNNEKIEVYRYYFDRGSFVYIARFKDSPNIVSTTWYEQNGKVRVTKGNIVIFENDSIQIVIKNKMLKNE